MVLVIVEIFTAPAEVGQIRPKAAGKFTSRILEGKRSSRIIR
jgi:hypothetical protein